MRTRKEDMQCQITKKPHVGIISFFDDLNGHQNSEFSDKLDYLIKKEVRYILLDFTACEFISSNASGIILEKQIEIKRKEGRIILFVHNHKLKNLTKLLGIDHLLSSNNLGEVYELL